MVVAAREIFGGGVAADVAIDARGVHVKRTADILFHFFVLIRHADLADQGCVISSGTTSASNCSPVK